ncbi:alpha/beta fold hydrolase [Arthrobacter sp. BE255]|uniref:alpha/beta fold hydrolase n=1 Tax=Arthrobacter sp. BE255 TaxID=2817721 RepID=UPI00286A92AA|nr:alpha/beta fold hydrolase [Arthrobacter sp. BE255]
MSNRHQDYVAAAGYELSSPDASRLLVLLHGLGGDRNQALGLIRGAALNDIAVLAPDARAHGATALVGEPSDFTFPAMVADLLALIRATGQAEKPTYIAGISMGAALALHTVYTHALDLRGAGYIRPAFSHVPFPEHLKVMKVIAEILDQYGQEEGLHRFTETVAYQTVAAISPSGAASLRDQFTKPGVLERSIRLAEIPRNTAFDSAQSQEGKVLPALIVGTPGDPVHPLLLAENWAAQLPHAKFVQVPSRDDDPVAYEKGIQAAVLSHVKQAFQPDTIQ